MTRTRVVLMVLTAVLLTPTQAHAARGFWGWLEELSGPGPFWGVEGTQAVACVGDKDRPVKWCLDPDKKDGSRIPQTIMVGFGLFESRGARFSDLPADDPGNQGSVRLMSLTGLYMFSLHRSLEVGPGAGVVRLSSRSGHEFPTFYRPVLIPIAASVSPLTLVWPESKYARVLRLEFDYAFFPKGFEGEDFNNTQTTFDSGAEFNKRYGIVVDVGVFLWRR